MLVPRLPCWSPTCHAQFATATARQRHHLMCHEQLTLRDGTVLTPLVEDEEAFVPVVGGSNGTHAIPPKTPQDGL